jgi:hypothetical protein
LTAKHADRAEISAPGHDLVDGRFRFVRGRAPGVHCISRIRRRDTKGGVAAAAASNQLK